jgi:hypothetical protein
VVLSATSCVQAIDLIDEAGSRVRISAYNARKEGAVREDPKVDEYLQVNFELKVTTKVTRKTDTAGAQ